MIIVIDIICVLLLILALFFDISFMDGDTFISIVPIILCLVAFGATIWIGVDCTELRTYDNQIAIIEEQNATIENEITTIVLAYEEYEKETFISAKINSDDLDFIAVAEMYPDLKSNELVKSQIEVYKANNEKLTKLKLEKARGSALQWWLYFKPFN